MTRELALLGYFTSKVGITENMEYVAVPAASMDACRCRRWANTFTGNEEMAPP